MSMNFTYHIYCKPLFKKWGQKLILLSTLLFELNLTILASENTYRMTIEEIQLIDYSRYSFSVYIENVGEKFDLTSYQCVFNINGIIERSNLSFKYVGGSSELNNKPTLIVGVENIDGSPELVFASLPAHESITAKTLVGTFILDVELEDNIDIPQILWDFEGSAKTIISGIEFINVTDEASHSNALSIIKTVSNSLHEENPIKFELNQNYPNPFNAFTRIKFSLAKKSKVSIIIYNVLGEPVKKYLNREFIKGHHNIDINTAEYSSGIYFYRIIAGDFVATKKMILLK